MFSWPFASASLGAGTFLLTAVAAVQLWRGGNVRPAQATSVALICFAALNALLIALNRNPEELHHRHWDTLALLPLGIVALGAQLAFAPLHPQRSITRLIYCFTACTLIGLCWRVSTMTWPYISTAHAYRAQNVDYYRELLLSGKIKRETDRINRAVKANDFSFFDDPQDRYAMPPVMGRSYIRISPRALVMLSPEIIPGRNPSLISRLTKYLIDLGGLLLIPALICAFFGCKKRCSVTPYWEQ